MWTFTMHDLLCGIIWIHDVSPSDITEIFALSQGFHRFTDLYKKEEKKMLVLNQKYGNKCTKGSIYVFQKNLLYIVYFCLKQYVHLSNELLMSNCPCQMGNGIVFPPRDYRKCPLYCKRCLDCKQVKMPLNSATEKSIWSVKRQVGMPFMPEGKQVCC